MYYPQKVGRSMDEADRVVKAFQISNIQRAVPAGWPNDELIGDRIIVTPTTDGQAVKKLEEFERYDRWFCHKPFE